MLRFVEDCDAQRSASLLSSEILFVELRVFGAEGIDVEFLCLCRQGACQPDVRASEGLHVVLLHEGVEFLLQGFILPLVHFYHDFHRCQAFLCLGELRWQGAVGLCDIERLVVDVGLYEAVESFLCPWNESAVLFPFGSQPHYCDIGDMQVGVLLFEETLVDTQLQCCLLVVRLVGSLYVDEDYIPILVSHYDVDGRCVVNEVGDDVLRCDVCEAVFLFQLDVCGEFWRVVENELVLVVFYCLMNRRSVLSCPFEHLFVDVVILAWECPFDERGRDT